MPDLTPLLISLKVTVVSTGVVAVLGIALSLWLARTRFRGRSVVETVVTMPLVLPPTVVGYYLLYLLGRHGLLGDLLSGWGINVVFTWAAAVIASVVVSLPLMVRASVAALEGVDQNLESAARTLGSPTWRVFLDVTLPLASRGLLAGLVLAFARGLGEFGATLMVAGNIPGRTQTLPLAIYTAVQSNSLGEANQLVLIVTVVAFIMLFAVNRAQRRWWR